MTTSEQSVSRRDFFRNIVSRSAREPETLASFERLTISASCFAHSSIYCRTCGDMCQEHAIRFQLKPGGRAAVQVNAELCNGCGDCATVCPANAITIFTPDQIQEAQHA